ncbi:MAG: B12-binding domain-containing radical SAM protein [Bryobacteraceae bacterium]|nr:B12-binding domain-containing radical SAM protein [Bryobacteraceae bacterium]
MQPAADIDVLFADIPWDFSFPESSWCLGYRYMIASLRRHGFSARILHPPSIRDGPVRERMIQQIVGSNAQILGFTTYDVQLGPLLEFIKDLRRRGLRSHVTLGGLCASAAAEALMAGYEAIDSVVFGEGETSIVELASQIIRGTKPSPIPGVYRRDGRHVVTGGPRPLVEDLDSLTPPVLDDFADPECNAPLRLTNGCVPATASRGCYGRCSFCCVQKFYRSSPGKTWRGRGAAAVAEEISRVTAATGCHRITFVDENFMGPGTEGRTHAVEVAREIKRRTPGIQFNFGCRANDVDRATMEELKSAGLAAVTLGIESMSAEALRLFNKGTTPAVNYRALAILDELELFTEITFIFFHPLSTLREVRENLRLIEYVRQSKYLYFNNRQPFSAYIPFFGTDLAARLERKALAERTLHDFRTSHADPRVAFIAQAVLAGPSDALLNLRSLLPEGRSPELTRMRDALLGQYVHLNMVRIPELVERMCDGFDQGEDISGSGVCTAAAELQAEARRIETLTARFLAHVA